MRVVHASTHVDEAGREPGQLLDAWPTLTAVAAAVAAAGVSIDVVTPAARDARLEHAGVRFCFVSAVPAGPLRRRAGYWLTPAQPAVGRAIAALDPDVIHFHSLSFPMHVARLAQLLPRTPILIQDHGDPVPPAGLRRVWRRGLASIAGTAFMARAQGDPWRRKRLLPEAAPVFEVPESSTRFMPGPLEDARAITGLYGDPCLLWTGHLDGNKDPLTVLRALAEAASALPDAHLWMAFRKDSLLPDVRRRIDEDDRLHGRVHLLGPQPHARIELLLRAADFLVQGSHREGSGYAVIEALACGTTPLVTAIPSFRALTRDGAYGGLSAPGDAPAMAASLIAWSARDRTQLRARARHHFERTLTFERIGSLLHESYTRLLASRTHVRAGQRTGSAEPPITAGAGVPAIERASRLGEPGAA